MKLYQSRVGYVLAVLYCVLAGYVAVASYKCRSVEFVPCDLGIVLVTWPAAWLLYGVLKMREYDFANPTPGDVLHVIILIGLCAAAVYFAGYAVESAYQFLRGGKR